MFGRLLSGVFNVLPALTSKELLTAAPTAGGTWSLTTVRTRVRNHFPIAREARRLRVHGWHKRMSTPEGRRIIMRRILRGRHCLSH